MSSFIRSKVTFPSGKEHCTGYLYLPHHTDHPLPGVIMGHGFSGTQDTTAFRSAAETFADAGFAVLTFDYRNFGESQGKPRQVIVIKKQQDDFRAALAWARSQSEIDPKQIALWGSSLGGAHTIFVAARDHGIAAVIAQIPYAGRSKGIGGRSKKHLARILWLALKDRLRGWLGLHPLYVPAVGSPGEDAILVDPFATEITKSLEEHSSWKNQVAPRIVLDILRLKPLDVVGQIQAPLLVTIAEKDTEAPTYLTKRLAELAPLGEARCYPYSHYEMYRQEVRQAVAKDQIDFLKKHLGQPPKD